MNLPICEQFLVGKSTRKHFGKETNAKFPLQFFHIDIFRPMTVRARHGVSYFITFIDNYSRNDVVYLISHKSKALSGFGKFLLTSKNQVNTALKTLRTDRRCEYLSDQFKELCLEMEINRHLTYSATKRCW